MSKRDPVRDCLLEPTALDDYLIVAGLQKGCRVVALSVGACLLGGVGAAVLDGDRSAADGAAVR
jgi:hypothetical protein